MATGSASAGKKRPEGAAQVTAADIEEQLNRLRSDIGALADTISAYGSTKVGEARARADKAGAGAVEGLQQGVDALNAELKSLEQALGRKVRDKPLQALGIAAGIGFLFAMLMRR